MILLFFIFITVITFFIILLIKISKKSDSNNYFPSHDIYREDDMGDSLESESPFAYPDPYSLPPESSMYLDEDGELLDDL